MSVMRFLVLVYGFCVVVVLFFFFKQKTAYEIVTDGEQGKESFFGYINDRFNGFELQPVPPGHERNPRAAGREYLAFPDYYAWAERIAASAGGRGGDQIGRAHV